MQKDKLKKYEDLIVGELKKVEGELKTVGRKNPSNPTDWEPMPDKMDTLASDDNEVADTIESYEENSGILKQLEIKYNELKNALGKIKNGTYGVCEICGELIEEDRLNANLESKTCKKHM